MELAPKIPDDVLEVRDYVRNIFEDLEPIFGHEETVRPSNGLRVYRRAKKRFSSARFPRLPQFKVGSVIDLCAHTLSRVFADRGTRPNPAVFSELLARRTTPRPEQPTIVPSPRRGDIVIPRLADLVPPLVERVRPLTKFMPALAVSVSATMLAILVRSMVFAPAEPPPYVQRPVAQVTATSLNCRAEPNATSEVLQTAKRGHKLLLHDRIGRWRHVRLHGSECWVSSEYLRPSGRLAFDRAMTGP